MKEEKMKSKIEELSIEDIIKRVGFFVSFADLRATYKYNISENQIRDFESKMIEEIESQGRFEKYLKLVKEHEDMFDKELYVFRAGRLLQNTYEKLTSPVFIKEKIAAPLFLYNGNNTYNITTADDVKKLLNKSRKMLLDSDVVDLEATKDNNEIKIHESRIFVGKTTKVELEEKKSKERLQRIEEEIGLENVVSLIQPTDLIDVCKYPNLGNLLAVNLIEDGKKINQQRISKIHDRASNKEIDVAKSLEKGKFFDWDKFIDEVRKNIKYIDIDKMLLLANAVFYNRYKNEIERFPVEEARELREFTRKVESLLENKKVSVKSYRFNDEIDFNLIKSSVESLNKHYINDRYYDDVEINELAKEITSGTISVTALNEEEFRETMQFSLNELIEIVSNKPESLQQLNERGWLDEEELQTIIKGIKNITKDQLLYLYTIEKLDNSSIIEYYQNNKISLESIQYLRDNLEDKTNLETAVSSEELVGLYLDEEKKKEFVKYRDLYKALRISGKDIEDKKEVANEILEVSNELISEEKMKELYHMGLIPLDTYIDFVEGPAISEVYLNGELKPVDAKRLYEAEILKKDMIIEFLKDDKIEKGKKLVLIYSTFSEKEDEELRNELMKYVKTTKKSSYNKGEKSRSSVNLEQSKNKGQKYFTDPCARWNLLASLDSDYSLEYKGDGSAICYLPNRKKYIIEKLNDKDDEPAYGAATYILDEEEYINNKDKIIEGDVVNRTELVKLRNSVGIKRLIHTGWSNAICKFFDIEDTSKYTEEQIKQIKKFSKQVEESKRPMTRE